MGCIFYGYTEAFKKLSEAKIASLEDSLQKADEKLQQQADGESKHECAFTNLTPL